VLDVGGLVSMAVIRRLLDRGMYPVLVGRTDPVGVLKV